MRTPAFVSLLLVLAATGGLVTRPALALETLDDAALQDVSGTGIAIALDDFEFAMAPTSYFEQVGTAPLDIADDLPGDLCTGTGSIASNTKCWRRGDLRWYGINISGADNTGYHWDDSTTCSATSLNCPRGGVIRNFSPFDNPYILRAWSPPGVSAAGECVNGATGNCSGSITKTIYEFLAPTAQPDYTFSWWGEMESGSTRNSQTEPLATNAGSVIKSQNIIRGNAAGSVFRLFNYGTAANPTFAMYYHSYLRGDYRFSVAQAGTGNDTIGQPTVFADTEGMYFRNVNAFIPVGQLYYQALTIKALGTSGNFELSLTPLPSGATTGDIAVQNKHYGIVSGGFTGAVNTTRTYNEDGQGYETARANNNGDLSANWGNYKLTHGYSRWGTWNADGGYASNAIDSDIEGIFFKGCTGCTLFSAFADRPIAIDKRGTHFAQQEVQNYNCATNNTGGCSVIAAGGPITTGDFNGTLTDQCNAYGGEQNCYTHNGRDPDPGEQECQTRYWWGGCQVYYPSGIPTPAGDPTKTFPTQTVNLGESRIEGLMIQTLRIQSCGGVAAC